MSDKFEYGTGRRKTATARTRVYAGSGNITVNGRAFEDYFPRKTLQMMIRQRGWRRRGRSGRSRASRYFPRPAAGGSRPSSYPEEGRLPDPRCA